MLLGSGLNLTILFHFLLSLVGIGEMNRDLKKDSVEKTRYSICNSEKIHRGEIVIKNQINYKQEKTLNTEYLKQNLQIVLNAYNLHFSAKHLSEMVLKMC